ncbi:four helix bundle protein, partial [Nitratifractor sp.]
SSKQFSVPLHLQKLSRTEDSPYHQCSGWRALLSFKGITENPSGHWLRSEEETHHRLSGKTGKIATRIPALTQLLRSGTSIGANVVEAQDAQSDRDFAHKMSVSLKEARETRYWIYLLIESEYLDKKSSMVISLIDDLEEIQRLLISIVKTSRRKIQ